MGRIIFASPVPPMNTGTAPYLGLFLAEGSSALHSMDAAIVTTAEFGRPVLEYMGLPVIAVDDYEPHADDVVIAFFANNRFHRFAYALAEKRGSRKKLISVLHDPQCFMNVSDMYSARGRNSDTAGLAEHIKYEVPKSQPWILSGLANGKLPSVLSWNLMAQSKILGISDAIVVHSYYAGLRLTLESGHGVRLPKILIMQFPRDGQAMGQEREKPDKFSVGSFGWIAPHKRPLSVIKGFAKFLSALPDGARSSVELKFVGALSDKTLDPLHWAKIYGLERNCIHRSGLPDEAFAREMASVSLLCNLRFPSCGETSGTLNLAHDLGVSVAMSAYQAFREEDADYLISLDPAKEIEDIAAAITTEYEKWLSPDALRRTRPERRYPLPRKLSVAETMSYILNAA